MRKHLPLIAILSGFFIVMLDTTIVNVSLYQIGSSLGVSTASLQWVVDAYALAFAASLLSAGNLCDRFGAKRVYLTGLLLFGLFSAGCALSPSISALIAARAAQGVGAALIVPGSLGLIAEVYKDPGTRSRVIGLWGAAGGVAAALGPIVGGALVSGVGWRAVFWVNIPVIIVLSIIAYLKLSSHDKKHGTSSFDFSGQALSIICMTALTFCVISCGEEGWSSTLFIPLVIFLATLGMFIIVEQRLSSPMLPLSLFSSRGFSTAAIVGFCLNLSFFGQLFTLSLYFQSHLNLSPWLAGLALAPQATSAIIASPLGGKTTSTMGAIPAMLVGLSIGSLGFFGLGLIDAHTPYALVAIASFLAGFGMAFAMPAATALAVNSVEPRYTGAASGVINAARQTGSVFGVALLGSMIGHGDFMTGFRLASFLAGLVFVLAGMVVLAMRTKRQRHLQ